MVGVEHARQGGEREAGGPPAEAGPQGRQGARQRAEPNAG